MSKVKKNAEKKSPQAELITFGCRLNIVESQQISQNLDGEPTQHNLAIFNTCTVTNEAEKQARQAIRKYHRQNPEKKIIVTGCAAQTNPEQFVKMPEVTKILGNREKFNPANYKDIANQRRLMVSDIMQPTDNNTELATLRSFKGKSRAFLQVQNGCDHRCTFCKIPYGRGNSASTPMKTIRQQVEAHLENDMQEIVLTGVDATSYGQDLAVGTSFSEMIATLLSDFPSLKRLRLSSIDVAEIDDKLIDIIASEPRLMPHLHISLQSGDNTILTRMKRRHTRQQVIDFCQKIRNIRPEIAFGADIIAGFPTETEAMFHNTLQLVSEAGLQYLHVFPYSPKNGTPAAKLPQIDKATRLQRARLLRQQGEKEMLSFFAKNLDLVREVLVEKDNKGYTDNFIPVYFNDQAEIQPGSIRMARLKAVSTDQTMVLSSLEN